MGADAGGGAQARHADLRGDRRAARETGERGTDILSLLLDAEDEDGNRLSDVQIRDEVMTLLFAGHDTTTSTVSFMFYELARQPEIAARLLAEQDERCPGGGRAPSSCSPASCRSSRWCSTRRCASTRPRGSGRAGRVEPFEFAGHTVPARAFVNYCSWASHHLPDVFEEPEEFRPERFTPEARAALPKGAYVPFGGGSRTCIGMRFGQLEVRTIASLLLSRCTLSLPDGLRADDPPDADDQPQGGAADDAFAARPHADRAGRCRPPA